VEYVERWMLVRTKKKGREVIGREMGQVIQMGFFLLPPLFSDLFFLFLQNYFRENKRGV
jgi:hypothetical protein